MSDSARPLEHDAEALVDARVRTLLERYVDLTDGVLREVEEHVLEFDVPVGEEHFFGRSAQRGTGAESIRIAFSLDVLERYPEAEMAVVGSDLFDRLVLAIQARGHWFDGGVLAPTLVPTADAGSLGLRFVDLTAGAPTVTVVRHPVGRLLARVMLRAGPDVEEHLEESAVFDLSSGRPLPESVGDLCAGTDASAVNQTTVAVDAVRSPMPMEDVVPMIVDDLRRRMTPKATALRQSAEAAFETEVRRINQYYSGLMTDDASGAGREVIEREWERRRTEEERRHAVRGSVHPLQIREWGLLVQTAEWPLSTASDRVATFTAHRPLSGDGAWTLTCPACGETPDTIHVCIDNHPSCQACSACCTVCGEWFCADHGTTSCVIAGHPACANHSDTCAVCQRGHCTEHVAPCVHGAHDVCAVCVIPCARCGDSVCTEHARITAADAPRGQRTLCAGCVVFCEGGQNEAVGRDEAVECATCEQFVCARHQSRCDVDGLVHCSKHLRRSDHTRRLVCEGHRSHCDEEPGAVMAADEVGTCTSCGKLVCDRHGALCAGHGERFCTAHLKPLLDTRGEMGCEEHRSVCHVDQSTFSLEGTVGCPACGKMTCRNHLSGCASCGRRICTSDLNTERTCFTCRRLAPVTDPDDDLITAALLANDGEPVSAKSWRVNQDASHRVVEADLGWTRRIVFSVRHEDSEPDTVIRHSVFGSKQTR